MDSVLEKIDYIALKTMEAHPEFKMCDNFNAYFLFNYDPIYFTSRDGARDLLETIPKNELIYEIGKFAMQCGALFERVMEDAPSHSFFMAYGRSCYEFYKNVKNGTINSFAYLLTHHDLMANLARCFGYYRYDNTRDYYDLIDNFCIVAPSYLDALYLRMVNVKNVNVRRNTLNKCLDDLKSGKQIKLEHSEYSLDGKLFSVSDIGRNRESQEDSTLILRHPDNSEYKLAAVADGMGGLSLGGEVSNYTLSRLADWFLNLPVECLDDPDDMVPMMGKIVTEINKEVYDKFHGKSGCTLVFALVVNGETIVANLGDSRCYVLSDGKLKQVTEDDSVVYKLYKSGVLESKDDLRFHPNRNVITKAIGINNNIIMTNIKHLTDYDLLLLFSDGVTDFVSDDQIKLIAENIEPDLVASKIVEHAKYAVSKKTIKLEDGEKKTFTVEGGADNLSAVLFNRRG